MAVSLDGFRPVEHSDKQTVSLVQAGRQAGRQTGRQAISLLQSSFASISVSSLQFIYMNMHTISRTKQIRSNK
jgi:hypothetical protein